MQIVKVYRPEVVLLDLGLPGMDGYEVARRLRKSGPPNLVLWALTGYGQPECHVRCREAGFDRHLLKPVDPDALEAMLAQREWLVEQDASPARSDSVPTAA